MSFILLILVTIIIRRISWRRQQLQPRTDTRTRTGLGAHMPATSCVSRRKERRKRPPGGLKTSHSTDPRRIHQHPQLPISKHTAGADRKPEVAPRGFQVKRRGSKLYISSVKNYFNQILQHWGITTNPLQWNHLFSWPNKYTNMTQSFILCMREQQIVTSHQLVNQCHKYST